MVQHDINNMDVFNSKVKPMVATLPSLDPVNADLHAKGLHQHSINFPNDDCTKVGWCVFEAKPGSDWSVASMKAWQDEDKAGWATQQVFEMSKPTGVKSYYALSSEEQAKYDELTRLGLPEGQALLSAKAFAAPCPSTGYPTACYCVLDIKDCANMEELTEALKAYATAAKTSPGQLSASYCIKEGQVHFWEVMNSPAAMDAHIGNCFPSYAKMMAHAEMAEIKCSCNPKETEFWKASAGAWGAKKFVCEPHMV